MSVDQQSHQEWSKRGRLPLILFMLLTLGGTGVAVKLTGIYHDARRDAASKRKCDINAKVSCSDVARSKYAKMFGAPTALWGVAGYLIMALLAGLGAFRSGPRSWPLGALVLLVFVSLMLSGYLFNAAYFVLNKVCVYCTSLYVINIALATLLGVALVQRRLTPWSAAAGDLDHLTKNLSLLLPLVGFGAVSAGLVLGVGPQVGRPGASKSRGPTQPRIVVPDAAVVRPVAPNKDGGATRVAPRPKSTEPDWVKKMITLHTPGLGPKKADLYIVEFSDYECPFCQQSNKIMERVLKKYGHRIRIYHRHFPLDSTCFKKMKRQMHPNACFAAKAAICAHDQGKFWKLHDALFRLGTRIGKGSIRTLARHQGLEMNRFDACLHSPATSSKVQGDLAAGERVKVEGTPSYFMGGPWIPAFQPEGVAEKMFDDLFRSLDKKRLEHRRKSAGMRPRPVTARPTTRPAPRPALRPAPRPTPRPASRPALRP